MWFSLIILAQAAGHCIKPASSCSSWVPAFLPSPKRSRFGFGLDIPETTAERITEFLGFLASVPAETRVMLVLDAVNQLDATDGAHALAWLPQRLPPGRCARRVNPERRRPRS